MHMRWMLAWKLALCSRMTYDPSELTRDRNLCRSDELAPRERAFVCSSTELSDKSLKLPRVWLLNYARVTSQLVPRCIVSGAFKSGMFPARVA